MPCPFIHSHTYDKALALAYSLSKGCCATNLQEVSTVTATYKSSSHKNKWIKTTWLLKDDDVRTYIPHTKRFTKSNLSDMLNRYDTVFFKPTDGSGGAKIVKISKSDGKYIAKHDTTRREFSTQDSLVQWLKSFASTRSFILQKGIALAKSNGRPFDVRVMVQKTNAGVWEATALFCKVGLANKVTTNYNQGGSIKFIDSTLTGAGFNESQRSSIKDELRWLGVKVAKVFSKKSSGYRELGLDVAIDTTGRLWILEVNTRPQIYPLKNMNNGKLYRKILSYAKHYGRKS